MIKKILLAPDSYKGTMTANRACEIMEKAINNTIPDITIERLPVSDGGEGLVDAFMSVSSGNIYKTIVHDPLNRKIEAEYVVLEDGTAVIEMAAAAGLPLLTADERNPLLTSSYGVGELIKDALDRGCRKILLGLGGSATTDGGIGAATALGYNFHSSTLQEGFRLSGESLGAIDSIDISNVDPRLKNIELTIACDVDNPLHGKNGASYIYAPQKGASIDDVKTLDENLKSYSEVINKQYNIDLQLIPGSGAAGGLAVPFLILNNVRIESGLDIILDYLRFREKAIQCDLIVTGEGKTDEQSSMGKVLSGVARIASEEDIPVISISGGLNKGYEALYTKGMTAMFSTCRQIMTLDEALATAEECLYNATVDLFKLIKVVNKT